MSESPLRAAVERWLAGEASDEDAALVSRAVREDAQLRAELAERVALEAELRRRLVAAASRAKPGRETQQLAALITCNRHARVPMRFPTWAVPAFAAAAALAVFLTLWLAQRPGPAPATATPIRLGTVDESDRGAVLHVDGTSGGRAGDAIRADDRIVAPGGGRIVIDLADGQGRVTVSGEARMPQPGMPLRLIGGSLEASITHRSAAAPLRFAAPELEIEIIGTRFTIAADDSGSRLEVGEGRVRARRPRDGAETEVAAGQTLLARATGTLAPSRLLRVGAGERYARFADLPELQPGDVVVVAAGVHRDRWRLTANGTAERPITVRGEAGATLDGEGVVLDGRGEPRALLQIEGQWCVVEGLTFTNARNQEGNAAGVRAFKVDHVTVRGCSAHDCDAGVYVHDCGEAVVEHCSLIRNGGLVDGGAQYGNLVVERLERLSVRWCELAEARRGDDLWSGARWNEIAYCRIAGADNAEIDLFSPDGADQRPRSALILGCLIESRAGRPGNQVRGIAFGDAGGGALTLVNDTLVSGLPMLEAVQAANDRCTVAISNCIVAGAARALVTGTAKVSGTANWLVDGCEVPAGLSATLRGADPRFAASHALAAGSPCVDAGQPASYRDADGVEHAATPEWEPRALPDGVARARDARVDLGCFEKR